MKTIAGITIAAGLVTVWLLAALSVPYLGNWKSNPAKGPFRRTMSRFAGAPPGKFGSEQSGSSNASVVGDKDEPSPDNATSSSRDTDPDPGRHVMRRFPYTFTLMELGALLWFLKLVTNLLLVTLVVLFGITLTMIARLCASEKPAPRRLQPSFHIKIEERSVVDLAGTREMAFTGGGAPPGAAELI